MQAIPYASACGSLMYAMISTRPDIEYAVGIVSIFMTQPGQTHWVVVTSIHTYLKGTKEKCICYGKGNLNLHGYCDSGMDGDVETRKSTYGYIYTIVGGAISALSTTEAEYISTTKASKEAIWLTILCSELGFPKQIPVLHCDNQVPYV